MILNPKGGEAALQQPQGQREAQIFFKKNEERCGQPARPISSLKVPLKTPMRVSEHQLADSQVNTLWGLLGCVLHEVLGLVLQEAVSRDGKP